jgi:hypothetical protein
MLSLLVVQGVCLFSLLTGGLEISNHTCHLGTRHPPASQSCGVVLQAHSTTIIFHTGIVLLVGLVNGDIREVACSQKLAVDFGMRIFRRKHVTQVD